MKSRMLAAVLAGGFLAGVGFSLPTPALAQTKSPTPAPAAPAPNPLAAQRKTVADTYAEVEKQRAAVQKIRAKIEATFSTKDEWVAAKKELVDAKAGYEAAVKPVIDKVRKDPEYLKAVADQLQAQKTLDDANKPGAHDSDTIKSDDDNGAPKGDVLKDAAALQLQAGLTKHRLETEAKANDPKLATAKARLDAAQKAYRDLQSQVDDAARSDPDYVKAQQKLTTAETAWVAAKTALAAAEKTQRDADAAKAKAAAPAPARPASSSGSSGSKR